MPVCEHLEKAEIYTYNGHLEGFLKKEEIPDPAVSQAFYEILHIVPDIHVCAGLGCAVSEEAISNRIIGYGDIRRAGRYPLIVPYVLYMYSRGRQRAVIVLPRSIYSSLYAKGLFYCLSDPGSVFEEDKNEIVTVTSSRPADIIYAVRMMHEMKASVLQRRLDDRSFREYDALLADACSAAEQLCLETEQLSADAKERTEQIRQTVQDWFLLKKLVYVQYMQSKELREERHGGSVKQQRRQAKENADRIRTVSYRQLAAESRKI